MCSHVYYYYSLARLFEILVQAIGFLLLIA